MKILISTGLYPPDIGGPATYSKLLASELPARGIQVDVLSFGAVRYMPKGVRHIAYFLKLIWHGRSADLFFAQDAVSVGVPTLLTAFLLGKIFVVRVPGDYAWEQSVRFGMKDSMAEFQKKKYNRKIEFLRSIQRYVVRFADTVIVPSHSFAEVVRSWVTDPTKVITIHNGIDIHDVASFAHTSFRPRTLISAGRLVPGKGFDELIRRMKRLEGWKLEIAGDGPEFGELQRIITEENLSERVTLLGRLERSELVKRIADSEIFVLNTHYETFSFQIVEAMGVGTPVVATNVGSIPEIIENGKSGILVDLHDENGFIETVSRISSERSFRDMLVDEARKKVAQFSIGLTVSKVADTFFELHRAPVSGRAQQIRVAKLLRYLFSGGTAAVADLVLLYVFTDIAGLWYVLSSVLAFLIAFVISFVLQKFFTFQDHGLDGVRSQALVYFVVTSTNLGINTIMIYAFVHYGGWHYIPAQIATSIVIAIESFIVYGKLIFKASAQKHP
jgi:glycosyltransferase involved in cell wall biosynthesis/putative flippase GtrA